MRHSTIEYRSGFVWPVARDAEKRQAPAGSSASLPDRVFTLLLDRVIPASLLGHDSKRQEE